MFNLKNHFNSSKAALPRPGVYKAYVTDVKDAPGFAPNQAVDIYYSLTDPGNGASLSYTERFFIAKPFNQRTADFIDHLVQIGLDRLEDYVGTELELTLSKVIKNGHVYTNITDRTYLACPNHQDRAEGGDSDV